MLRTWMLLAGCCFAASCATAAPDAWHALGYLAPVANDHPEFIGTYESEAECRAAVEGWMSRQVVGNPVHGDCIMRSESAQ